MHLHFLVVQRRGRRLTSPHNARTIPSLSNFQTSWPSGGAPHITTTTIRSYRVLTLVESHMVSRRENEQLKRQIEDLKALQLKTMSLTRRSTSIGLPSGPPTSARSSTSSLLVSNGSTQHQMRRSGSVSSRRLPRVSR